MRTPTFKNAEQFVRFYIETNAEIRENFKKILLKELKILEIFSATNVIAQKRVFKTHALNLIALYAVFMSTTISDEYIDVNMLDRLHFASMFCEKNGISKDFESSENFRRVKKLLEL